MATTFFQYPGSLANIDPDFGSSWTGDEEPSYELEGSSCLPCTVQTTVTGDRLDSESQRTVITESMSVTASDEEKLQLLNKKTELRRLNAELLKLNQQWDEIYHNATQKMHLTVRALQDEVQSLRHHSDKLSLKLEHEQMEIYAADYKTECTDRQRMKTENDKLRKKEKEMREQMLILEEQLKVYEDDFRKEHCDKQVLQRLLKNRNSTREPILLHRCNNVTHHKGSFSGTESPSRSGSRREQSGSDVEEQTEKYCMGF